MEHRNYAFPSGSSPANGDTGCGSQHPFRALGGTHVLLAAAPTASPCFRHWRRSSLLQNPRFRPNASRRGPTSLDICLGNSPRRGRASATQEPYKNAPPHTGCRGADVRLRNRTLTSGASCRCGEADRRCRAGSAQPESEAVRKRGNLRSSGCDSRSSSSAAPSSRGLRPR